MLWVQLRLITLVNKAFSFHFENSPDTVKWKWTSRGQFTTKSVYDRIANCHPLKCFKHIWKSKLPYKIKIFTWLLENKVILTKDNMIKKKWPSNPTCSFCSQLESVDHLFFQCSVARVTWGFVALCLGAHEVPTDILSYSGWIKKYLPGGAMVHHFIFAAFC